MKLGNITFTFGLLPIFIAALGLFTLFTNPVTGIALVGTATLLSSDWRHRSIAIYAVLAISLMILHKWLLLFALGLGAFLLYKKVPHAISYFFWLVAAVDLLSGHWIFAIILAACGAMFWKLTLA